MGILGTKGGEKSSPLSFDCTKQGQTDLQMYFLLNAYTLLAKQTYMQKIVFPGKRHEENQ